MHSGPITVFGADPTTPSWQRTLQPSPIQTKRPNRTWPALIFSQPAAEEEGPLGAKCHPARRKRRRRDSARNAARQRGVSIRLRARKPIRRVTLAGASKLGRPWPTPPKPRPGQSSSSRRKAGAGAGDHADRVRRSGRLGAGPRGLPAHRQGPHRRLHRPARGREEHPDRGARRRSCARPSARSPCSRSTLPAPSPAAPFSATASASPSTSSTPASSSARWPRAAPSAASPRRRCRWR